MFEGGSVVDVPSPTHIEYLERGSVVDGIRQSLKK
jgi:hypothetical protein